ncbi:DHA2 family efflux MFS transporter permease subunit [Conexibacter sp. DBS9H8]|uniref:DHA2 family efflux MFS transporter permease subunit n=1 Tax=Conexibacter sp. DBS9H8 TaxID=2937801 RepID=UPI00200D34EB|nr:DHA2 family efflux MFS transporter permease subunit [Conexibacter sp. DBS9H8]
MNSLSQRVGGAAPSRNASAPLVLVIVCAGVVLASLDLFIVNVALPSIARDLHQRNLSTLSWVLNGYAILYAALLVLFGRIAERFDRERGFLLGVLIFTAASAACGLAPSLGALIGCRLVQAVGAALMTPTSLGLILATTAPERRHSAVRTWAAIGGLAAALGPVVGGLLVAAGWRWVFFVNVPVGIVALAVGWWRLPRVPGHPVAPPNAAGALLVTAGIGALTLGLVEGNAWGWGSPRVLAALILGAVAVAAFARHTRTRPNPLIDPGLFRVRSFSGASAVSLTFSVAFGAMLLSIVLWMQNVWGWSALHTGLAFAPGPLMVPVCSFLLVGRLIARFGPGRVIAVGSLFYAAGVVWWALRAGLHPDYLGQVLPGTLLTGIGVGLTMPTFMATGSAALPPAAFATGSAVLNMLRQVGLAVGVALFVAVLGTPAGRSAQAAGFERAWLVIAGAAVLSAAVGRLGLGAAPRPAVAADAVSAPVGPSVGVS